MAKKRTKKDKQKTNLRRQALRQEMIVAPKGEAATAPKAVPIMQANHDLIKQDLRKTVIVTALILLVLFTIALLYT